MYDMFEDFFLPRYPRIVFREYVSDDSVPRFIENPAYLEEKKKRDILLKEEEILKLDKYIVKLKGELDELKK